MPQPACDRCSRRKERCLIDQGAQSCRRCEQHGEKCSFDRRQRRMGRRPRTQNLPYGRCDILTLDNFGTAPPRRPSISGLQAPTPADSGSSASPKEDSASRRVVAQQANHQTGNAAEAAPPDGPWRQYALAWDIMNEKHIFYHFHRHFMIGPSFEKGFRQAVRNVSSYADGILLEAYHAALSMWDADNGKVMSPSQVDMSAGTDGLRRLQSVTTEQSEDAAAMLMAGQVLLVHHVAVMCTSAHSIIRSALLQVRPFYKDLMSKPEMDPITVTPILVDTIESLVRREEPIIRTSLCDRFIVDRSVGVFWPLLSLLQELCDCSVRVKETGTTMFNEGRDMYSDIEDKIRRWEPEPPPTFFTQYNSLEVTAMLLQSRMYRMAALLIIHRLRYPLGVKDEEALAGANVIFAELTSFFTLMPQDMRAVPIGLPLLVAMLEIKEPGEALIPKLAAFEMHPYYAGEFKRFIDLIWDARLGGYRGLWCELATRFQMPLLP